MKTVERASSAAAAALAALLLAAPARAAVYELASEWMAINFSDGDKSQLLFTHRPDSDVFLQMKDYLTNASTKTANVDMYIPLVQLSRPEAEEAAANGSDQPLLLTSRPTPYKMLLRFDTIHRHHVIMRPPDFTTHDSTTSATILTVFGAKPRHPENFMIMVLTEEQARLRREQAKARGALGDVELAAVASLEPSERAALAGKCGGEPEAPAALACWRENIGELLNRHREEAPTQDLSAFEQRYIQNRLSEKGFKQFQSLQSSAGDGDKLSLARNWHELILDRDIASNAAVSVKNAAPAVGAPVAAATSTVVAPRAVPVAPKPPKPAGKPAVSTAVKPTDRAASPAQTSAPTPAPVPEGGSTFSLTSLWRTLTGGQEAASNSASRSSSPAVTARRRIPLIAFLALAAVGVVFLAVR